MTLGLDGTPAIDSLPAAERVLARADELARHSSMEDGIERVYLSPEHARVNAIAASWMREAGMHSWQDAAGNQCGRRSDDPEGMPALVLGSHLDTVPGAGRYDGILGVLVAIEVAERLEHVDLPFALEVVAFADEEGTRFGATLLGSRAFSGGWKAEWNELQDAEGTTLHDAALAFGLDPERIPLAARKPEDVVAYLEAHIEQGPSLERLDRALGVVTSIAAAERRLIRVVGESRHCATPWEIRRDALQGASEMILAIDQIARDHNSPATIGHISVEPDAVNVIPGLAEFSLDLRDATAEGRDMTWEAIRRRIREIALDRSLSVEIESTHAAPEMVCAPHLRESIAVGIRSTGDETPLDLFSVAGHDAMAVGELTDVAMLFVRCAGGISHHKDESVRLDDVAASIDAMHAAVLDVALRYSAGDADAPGLVP